MAATIYDVAKRAGVSTATVSKVLSNTPYVSEATRAKVLAAVAELGYVPSLAARGLTKARTYLLALVIPYTSDYLYSDPHLLELFRGIEQETRAREYQILLSTADRKMAGAHAVESAAEPYQRAVRSQYADGVIVVASSAFGSETPPPLAQQLPTVGIGYHALGGRHTVHSDDRSGAAAATRHLLALGHRRIGVITAVPQITALLRRLEGHRQALAEAGVPWDPALMVWGDFSDASGYRAVEPLLALPHRPTAIFSFNDRMAMGATKRLREAGLRVPEDVSVVGFDDIPAAAFFDPPLTTVRQPAREMGVAAARLLFDLIEGRPAEAEEIVLPTELVVRSSTGRLA
ncbi:MAG: LacI family transcriptional regulator [Caldilineales bacterium]|nr:LacI family transcriptional regulator [Caldilineales bacterium]